MTQIAMKKNFNDVYKGLGNNLFYILYEKDGFYSILNTTVVNIDIVNEDAINPKCVKVPAIISTDPYKMECIYKDRDDTSYNSSRNVTLMTDEIVSLIGKYRFKVGKGKYKIGVINTTQLSMDELVSLFDLYEINIGSFFDDKSKNNFKFTKITSVKLLKDALSRFEAYDSVIVCIKNEYENVNYGDTNMYPISIDDIKNIWRALSTVDGSYN